MDARYWLTGLILALSGAANAELNGNFYLGSGAGLYYVDFDDLDFDKSAPTIRLFGGYKLNDYVSFEAGFTNLFEIDDDVLGVNVKLDGTSWDVAVRPTLPVGDRFEAFGILGYSWYDWTVELSDGVTTVNDDDKDSELLYGLGGAWHINDAWTLRGEWTAVDVSDADFGMFSASVSYNFQ